MEYNFRKIERSWQDEWRRTKAYAVSNESPKPKYYVLDMFPYPSGTGLHVGHPLGYIASDIFTRFKRLQGFNVLHPMGYDAFGLPAEQYAIEHGIHPADSTRTNIANFRDQMDRIGFGFDWDREVNTSDPAYYKWTQWIFLKLFGHFFNRNTARAESIAGLVKSFEAEGNRRHPFPNSQYKLPSGGRVFSADEWKSFDEFKRGNILMEYRLAYCGVGEVNWCEALGTVLANDEVINGVSERGGYPVVRKKLRQWYLRITEYSDRLLEGLERVEFSDAMKEMQSNWIGRSYGAEIDFRLEDDRILRVYTTRPDTIFGVDFMVVSPEHPLIATLATPECQPAVDAYLEYVQSRSERERMAEKKISGVFTGTYAINPFNGVRIPVWIAEYVLAGYGTGAIMAVPCGDERDFKFAQHFSIPITNIIGAAYDGTEANPTKDAVLSNSGFLDGMKMTEALDAAIARIEETGIGTRKVNYKMRDAAFSRQRYWGEPFPIKWEKGVAQPLPERELPLELPHIEKYGPGPDGEGPLANVPEWTAHHLETNTMPGYAGSSWYFLRYMDPHNTRSFCDRTASDYWGQVDLYIGGTEHAVGHLMYSRMWTKFLYDTGEISHDEPFRRLLNQGMITGVSQFIYRRPGKRTHVQHQGHEHSVSDEPVTVYYSNPAEKEGLEGIRIPIQFVDGNRVDVPALMGYHDDYASAVFVTDGGFWFNKEFFLFPDGSKSDIFISEPVGEKMSKSKLNTLNPNDLVDKYGADTFRMYEMFLGPVEQSKPWDTKGIEGVHRFLRKLWRLFYEEDKGAVWTSAEPTPAELKVLHRAIKKITEDTGRFSFNTCVSAFMVCVNELTDLNCRKRAVLGPLLVLLTPFAPHICEELWHGVGNTTSVLDAAWPSFNPAYLEESTKEYPVSINGKTRTMLTLPASADAAAAQAATLANDVVVKWMEGRPLKKFVFVPGRMINVVL